MCNVILKTRKKSKLDKYRKTLKVADLKSPADEQKMHETFVHLYVLFD